MIESANGSLLFRRFDHFCMTISQQMAVLLLARDSLSLLGKLVSSSASSATRTRSCSSSRTSITSQWIFRQSKKIWNPFSRHPCRVSYPTRDDHKIRLPRIRLSSSMTIQPPVIDSW